MTRRFLPGRRRKILAHRIAAVLRAGEWTADALAVRLWAWFGGHATRSAEGLAEATLARHPVTPPSETRLAKTVEEAPAFSPFVTAVTKRGALPPVPLDPAVFTPAPAFAALDLPRLATPGDLAAWAGLSTDELDWFADPQERLAHPRRAGHRHYRWRWSAKRAGGHRLIEAPRPRLKALQRDLLDEILAPVPAHAAAFGFVRGRDCRAHAARHAGEEAVATLDLADFFASVPALRVAGIFAALGYPAAVARLLAGLATVATPAAVVAACPSRPSFETRARLGVAHLPQGAPTSPALANLAAYRLDRRLSGLARTRGLAYSRYADDIAFSGPRGALGAGFLDAAERIACDEGFCPNPAKRRLMRRGTAQRVTGLVVNDGLGVPRAERDRLRAILTNCLAHGPASQNRDGHADFRRRLEGRVAWVAAANPRHGRRLYALLDRVEWPT